MSFGKLELSHHKTGVVVVSNQKSEQQAMIDDTLTFGSHEDRKSIHNYSSTVPDDVH